MFKSTLPIQLVLLTLMVHHLDTALLVVVLAAMAQPAPTLMVQHLMHRL